MGVAAEVFAHAMDEDGDAHGRLISAGGPPIAGELHPVCRAVGEHLGGSHWDFCRREKAAMTATTGTLEWLGARRQVVSYLVGEQVPKSYDWLRVCHPSEVES